MHTTKPARRSFRILARCNGVGGNVGFLLPVRALNLLVIVGVSALLRYAYDKKLTEKRYSEKNIRVWSNDS